MLIYPLMDAIDRIVSASQILAVNTIIVDAKDEKSKSFYERYGFEKRLPDAPGMFRVWEDM